MKNSEYHIIFRKQQHRQPIPPPSHKVTQSNIFLEGHHQGSQCSQQKKSLGTNPKGKSSERKTSTPTIMEVQTQEEHQYQTSVQTQGTPQLPQQKTRICLEIFETFSPFVSWFTIRIVLVLSIINGCSTHQVNVVT